MRDKRIKSAYFGTTLTTSIATWVALSSMAVTLSAMVATASGCSSHKSMNSYICEANSNVASVIKLTDHRSEHYLTDYFPELSEVDSLSSSELEVRSLGNAPQEPNWSRFEIITNPQTDLLSEIKVWIGDRSISLVVQNRVPESLGKATSGITFSGGAVSEEGVSQDKVSKSCDPLFMATLDSDDNIVTVGFNKKPEKIVALWQNVMLPSQAATLSDNKIKLRIPNDAKSIERSYIRLYASDQTGIGNDILVPLTFGKPLNERSQISRHDPQAQILYSLMIDRFSNGNPANDRKINSKDVLDQVDYQGGDLVGITQKITSGFFTDLGITTIWLSPITQNPHDAWGQNLNPRTKFSAYHGYWPIYSTAIDSRFGNDAELRELLDEAHSRNINVILDYVANHLHINSPVLKQNPDWVTPLILEDGRKNLSLWDEQRLTTWFDEHIPTLDLERQEVYEPMTDSAMHWIKNFDFDGFRHDATKHIPEVYWRTLTRKMRDQLPGRKLYQIGETYGSEELIGSYVKSGMLDAQFDFNVYDAATGAIATPNGSMATLEATLKKSLNAYGFHNSMGYITGNHDRPRFISLAGGELTFEEDSKAAGWSRNVGIGDPSSYNKLALLEAFMFTIPGVPCIYQGDEYGVPGANDPDNRRMMQFGKYTDAEQILRNKVQKLTHLRQNLLPLIFGDYLSLYSDDGLLVFARIYMGEVVIVALNSSESTRTVNVNIPFKLALGAMEDSFGESIHTSGSSAEIKISPLSFDIFK